MKIKIKNAIVSLSDKSKIDLLTKVDNGVEIAFDNIETKLFIKKI